MDRKRSIPFLHGSLWNSLNRGLGKSLPDFDLLVTVFDFFAYMVDLFLKLVQFLRHLEELSIQVRGLLRAFDRVVDRLAGCQHLDLNPHKLPRHAPREILH